MRDANDSPSNAAPTQGGGCLKGCLLFLLAFVLLTGCFAFKDWNDERKATSEDGSTTVPVTLTLAADDGTFEIDREGTAFIDHGDRWLTVRARPVGWPDNQTPWLRGSLETDLDLDITCEMRRSYMWSSRTGWMDLDLRCSFPFDLDGISGFTITES